MGKMDEVDFYLKDLESKFKKIDKSKYYLSYSGGKDSHFLYWFIKEYLKDNEIEIVGVNTYMEHPEIRDRILKNCDVVLYPKLKPFEIKEKYGSPCFSKIQDEFIKRYQSGNRSNNTMKYVLGNEKTMFKLNKKAKILLLNDKLHKISPLCCKYLKKEPAAVFLKKTGKHPILGVRGSESKLRGSKYKSCFTKDKKFTPLHDLSDELLDMIYQKYKIETPKIYSILSRTGCMGCPYGKNVELELSTLPNNQRNFVCRYFKESYEVLGINTDKQITIFDFIESVEDQNETNN